MKVSTELYPWRHHFLGLSGLNLNYVDEGTGPAMLMVHGNPTWSYMWRNFVRELGTQWRVIAIDQLGMGFSSRSQTLRTLA
jgi:haloalkane dehalogenase